MIYPLLVAGWMALGPADPAAGDELKSQVRQLTRQLDAAELPQREAAEQKLLDLGPAVLELLPPVTNRTSAEVKERLARVRDKLQRAEAEAVVRPRLVTLDFKDAPLSEVLKSIQDQTGNKIVDYRQQLGQEGNDPPITIKLADAPFWKALDETLDEGNSTEYGYADDVTGAVAVSARPAGELRRQDRTAHYSGPFRVEATRLESQVDLRNPANRSLQLDLELAWEPRLQPIHVELPLSKISAVDESGGQIDMEDAEGALESSVVTGVHSTQLTLPLGLPRRNVQRIDSLKGQFSVLIPGRVETFRFTDFTKANQDQKLSGATVTLQSVRRNNEVWEFRVRVKFEEASGALQSHFGWIYNNPAYLLDKNDQEIQPDGAETTRQTEDEVGMAYLFGIEGKLSDYTFVYKTPTVIIPMPVDFELKDLELP